MPDPRPDPVPVADPALPASLDRDASLAATERWFLRRGIPHFIEGYRASDDIFTRALPVLSLVLLVELLGAANLAWSCGPTSGPSSSARCWPSACGRG